MLQYLNPFAWGRWFFEFVSAWFLGFPWRDAPKGIPALLLMTVLIVGSVIAWTDNSNWRTELLNKQLMVAIEADQFETAELVIQRQLKKRPDDAQLVYRLALLRAESGQGENATQLMLDLAKYNRHEEAARWMLAENYIGKDWGSLDDDQRAEFGQLLKIIHEEAPKDVAIQQLYADYLIASEKFPQAIPILEQLARFQPMRGLQAAALSRRLGNPEAANRLAKMTLDAVALMSEEDPTNSVLALAVAQNQLFLKRYPESLRTLERSIKRAKTKEEAEKLKQAYGDATAAWIGFIEQSEMSNTQERLRILRLLEKALNYAPTNPRVLTIVADQVLATLDDDDEQVVMLRESLINGSSSGIAHFIRGTAALMEDDVETATTALRLAAQHMPRSGAILNNLAVALSVRDSDNLEEALKISDTAIKQTTNPTPHFFETRGQILFRLGRYVDAIPDLERSLTVESLAQKSHESLATCYEKIGEEDLSKLHQQAAIEVAKRTGSKSDG